jgi:transposase
MSLHSSHEKSRSHRRAVGTHPALTSASPQTGTPPGQRSLGPQRHPLERSAPALWRRFYLLATPGRLGSRRHLGADLASLLEHPGSRRKAGMGASVSRWQLRPSQKGGDAVGYGRKGKGSQRHLIVDGAGRPLAFTLTGEEVNEKKVALQTVDRIWVKRGRGRPKRRPKQLAADAGYDSRPLRRELWKRGGSRHPFQNVSSPSANGVGKADRPRCTQ